MITLICSNFLLELDILGTEALVFLLETLGDVLESNVPFDLSLLIELDACLQFCKLRLLALSESALCGSSSKTTLARTLEMHRQNSHTCSGRGDRWHLAPKPR
jgi:hypothetical protein